MAGDDDGDCDSATSFGAGVSSQTSDSASANTGANSAFALWLNSQFAKPGDFDAKIAALTEQLNKELKEHADATRAAALTAAQAEKTAMGANAEATKATGIVLAVQMEQGGIYVLCMTMYRHYYRRVG